MLTYEIELSDRSKRTLEQISDVHVNQMCYHFYNQDGVLAYSVPIDNVLEIQLTTANATASHTTKPLV